MWSDQNWDDNSARTKGYYTPPPTSKTRNISSLSKPWMSDKKKNSSDAFHVIYKVPHGDSPYVKAKHVQMIEKDPGKAVSLFWNAINSGDRVDSALKDMAAVMKQLNRSDEAIEAIKSFRNLCPPESQESLDNVLVELYKRSGRLEEEIEVLLHKLKRVEEGNAFGRKKLKLARSQGKRVHITAEQEYARLLGNLAWAYLQLNDYSTAEKYYRKALSIEADRNKQCNLAVCLMCMNQITEARLLLQSIQILPSEGKTDVSFTKSFERALELLAEIESQPALYSREDDKENSCSNVSVLAFTPYKKPSEASRFCSGRMTADRNNDKENRVSSMRRRILFQDACTRNGNECAGVFGTDTSYNGQTTCTPSVRARKILRSPFTQPTKGPGHASWKTTNIPQIPAPRLPSSPFTQPRIDSSPSYSGCISEAHRNEPGSLLQRRLQLEKPAEPNILQTTDSERSYLSQDFIDSKAKKSWADIADEEEEEKKSGLSQEIAGYFSHDSTVDENVSSKRMLLLQNSQCPVEYLSGKLQHFSLGEDVRRSLDFHKLEKEISWRSKRRLNVF